jgi:endo-1,4-beta-xylanase
MFRLALVFTVLFLFSFTLKDEPPCDVVKLYEKLPFRVGTALNTDKLKNEEEYWKTALAHYNSFTPEKILKPKYIHPKKESFDFWETDHLMEFCRQNNFRLHGHTLVWHNALPEWIERFEGNAAAWDSLLKNHIQTIVNHCKGTIRSWDVVNEAFNDDGTVRKNIWYKNLGESYIEKSFLYAAEADPTAKLFYNDYSLEKNGDKLTVVLEYLRYFKSKGIRVDGIGMQMHVSLTYPDIKDINAAAQRIQDQGYLVHYSELDVTLLGDQPLFVSKKKLYAAQRERIRSIVEGYMKLEPSKRFGITLWGVSDNDSWLTDERIRSRPLLFDRHYRPKPAYCGFIEGAKAVK